MKMNGVLYLVGPEVPPSSGNVKHGLLLVQFQCGGARTVPNRSRRDRRTNAEEKLTSSQIRVQGMSQGLVGTVVGSTRQIRASYPNQHV